VNGVPLFSENKVHLPVDLYGVPFADEEGIILSVKNVPVRHVEAPYNADLVKDENGNYLLIFRYDIKKKRSFKHNYIACVKLDEKFEQIGEFKDVDTLSDFSNDPRIFKSGSKSFLIYNDTPTPTSKDRIMKIAEFSMSSFQLKNIISLDRKIKPKEKNWIPFSYRNGSADEINFIYTINPYDVLKLKTPNENSLEKMNFGTPSTDFPWTWGDPRGGTQAELVDGEYLTFFHSSFVDRNRRRWYVMGAFTFEAAPPFRVTSVSPHPLLFKGIYDSPRPNGISSRLSCIFPSGLVMTDGNDKILVSCGENDAAVKIITFDKKALLNSLIKINR
jgi:predicted GH43/DUF377 family glycosyl hydrolase